MALLADRRQEGSCLVGVERMNLAAGDPRRPGQPGDVPMHELGPLGMAQGLAQDIPVVRHRPRRKTARGLGVEVRLDIGGPKRIDGDRAEGRSEVDPDDALVRDEGLGPDRQPDDLGQPGGEE